MERVFDALFEFATTNGVGISIPIAFYVVFKAVREDYLDSKAAGNRHQGEIHALQVQVARLEEKVASIEKAVY